MSQSTQSPAPVADPVYAEALFNALTQQRDSALNALAQANAQSTMLSRQLTAASDMINQQVTQINDLQTQLALPQIAPASQPVQPVALLSPT